MRRRLKMREIDFLMSFKEIEETQSAERCEELLRKKTWVIFATHRKKGNIVWILGRYS